MVATNLILYNLPWIYIQITKVWLQRYKLVLRFHSRFTSSTLVGLPAFRLPPRKNGKLVDSFKQSTLLIWTKKYQYLRFDHLFLPQQRVQALILNPSIT